MITLLDVPREIRNEVFSILLHESQTAPLPLPAEVAKSHTRRDPNDTSARKIRYPSSSPPIPTIKLLLLVNRQLHQESRAAIEHYLNCGSPTLKLDLLIESNTWLFPSWIQVLPYTPIVKKLHVSIRPFKDASSGTLGNPFVGTWHFGDLINVVLRYGPAFDFSGAAKPFIIEELLIDLVTDLSLVLSGANEGTVTARVQNLQDFMVGQIDGFLVAKHKRYHLPWGPILLSRVRTLKIMADDETLLTIDVQERARASDVDILETPS